MPQLLIAVAVTATVIGFGAGWKTQEWRYGNIEKQRLESQLENQRLATKTITRQHTAVIDAANQAKARDRILRMDADAARNSADGLRNALDNALRDSASSLDACTESSAKTNVVLMECVGEYQAVARDADSWQNDAMTLQQAWPK